MQAPTQVKPKGLADYLEVMTKSAFQSGISWRVIEAKWNGFREAFAKFDPRTIAGFDPPDVERLVEDTRIVRNRKKIEATIHNAQTLLDLDTAFGGFRKYLRSFGSFEELVADIRKRFKFLGDTGTYFFLYVVGEKVPSHQEWMRVHGTGAGRSRPASGRATSTAKRAPRGGAPSTAKRVPSGRSTRTARWATAGTAKKRTASGTGKSAAKRASGGGPTKRTAKAASKRTATGGATRSASGRARSTAKRATSGRPKRSARARA